MRSRTPNTACNHCGQPTENTICDACRCRGCGRLKMLCECRSRVAAAILAELDAADAGDEQIAGSERRWA